MQMRLPSGKNATLGRYLGYAQTQLTATSIKLWPQWVPGVDKKNGDKCPDGSTGQLQVFVNSKKLNDWGRYLPKDGDRIRLVFGPAEEDIEGITHPVRHGDRVDLPHLGLQFAVLGVPGHTRGHVAYAGHGVVFCGDTLFSGGCGRLFEGTAAQMQASLQRLAALPPETRVYCAHEYTASNLRFARVVEPDNAVLAAYADEVTALRANGTPTVPSTLHRELAINPFLRTAVPASVRPLSTACPRW